MLGTSYIFAARAAIVSVHLWGLGMINSALHSSLFAGMSLISNCPSAAAVLEWIQLSCSRFALMHLHGWNYDLRSTHESMKREAYLLLRGTSNILDINGNSLAIKGALHDPFPIPLDMVALMPPRFPFLTLGASKRMKY